MRQQKLGTFGWPTSQWAVVGVCAALLIGVTAFWLSQGVTESSLRAIVKTSVRLGLLAFLIAFSVGPLQRMMPNRLTARLLTVRPGIGVAFALSHTWFLGGNIARVYVVHDGDFLALRPLNAWVLGGAIMLVIWAMALTSLPVVARRVSRSAWTRLHRLGGYLVLLSFLNSYGHRALTMPQFRWLAGLVVAVLAVRVTAAVHRRRRHLWPAFKQCCQRCLPLS